MTGLKNFTTYCLNFVHAIEKRIPHLIGYIYGILANLCFSLLNMNVRKAHTLPPFQIYYLRTLSLATFLYFINQGQKQPLVTSSKLLNRMLIGVGTLGLLSGPCIFYGFQTVPLNEASVVYQTTPAMSGVLATLILHEAYDLIQFLSVVLCTMGVVLIAKPGFIFGSGSIIYADESQRMKGLISLLFAGFMNALQSLVIKRIVSRVSPNLSVFYIGLIPSLFLPFLMLTGEIVDLGFNEWVLCFNVMFYGFLAQLFYNRAYKFGDAGKIAMMGYSQIIFGYTLDIFILKTAPDFYSIVGSLFIFSCVFLRIYKTWFDAQKK